MLEKFVYLVELAAKENGKKSSWIEAFRMGKWVHPTYGDLKGTAKLFSSFIANFKATVLGHELPIDWQHSTDDETVPPDQRGLAAGWVKDIRVMGDRLQLLIEWTDKAASQIAAGEFKYFSPTFTDNYICKVTGHKMGPTLLGGALTNTPFLDLSPVVLSEKFSAASLQDDKGMIFTEQQTGEQTIMEKLSNLKPEQLKVWLAAFDATEGDEKAKCTAAYEAVAKMPPPEESKKPSPAEEEMAAKMSEMQKRLDTYKASEQKVKIDGLCAKLAEANADKKGIPPAIIEKVKIILSAPADKPIKLSEKVEVANREDAMLVVLTELKEIGMVDLSEQTATGGKKPENGIELSEADRKAYPGASDESIKTALLTEETYAKLPKEEQTQGNYAKCMSEASAKVAKLVATAV